LLGFELRQALAKGNTSTADGRVRVFEEVRRIMAGATSFKKGGEEIPLVGDRLGLPPESVGLLLQGEPGPARGRAAAGRTEAKTATPLAQRVLGGEASLERDFLVAVVCNPDKAAQFMEVLTPEHFADAATREAFVVLKETLAGGKPDRDKVLTTLQSKARENSETGPLFARLVMETDQGRFASTVLEELHLRLQEQFLVHETNKLRGALDGESDVAETQRRLVRLERLLQTVRAKMIELEPDDQ
jgi:hypothetical protein